MSDNQYWAVANAIAGAVIIVAACQVRGCVEAEERSNERVEIHCLRARGEWIEHHCRFIGGQR